MTPLVRAATRRVTGCAVAALVLGAALPVSPAAAQETPPAAGAVPATATVDISTNTPPRAGRDHVSTFRDVSVTVDLFVNDADPDGDPLSLMGATSAGHGVLSFAGSLATYTPDAGWSGVDDFTYLVADGRGGQDTGQVRVTVVAPAVAGPHQHPSVQQGPVTVAVTKVPPVAALPVPPAQAPVQAPVELPAAAAAPRRIGPPARAAASLSALPRAATAAAAPVHSRQVVTATPAVPTSLAFTGSRAAGLAGTGAGLTMAGILLVLVARPRRAV